MKILQASDRFEQLAQNAPVAFFIKDLEGRYTLANPSACEALGRADVVGFRDDELLDAASAERIREHDLEVIESCQSVEYQERVQCGELVQDYLAVKFPLLDERNDVQGVCGVAVAITSQHRVEEERALLAAIVSSSDDAIISMTLDGIITSWNQGGKNVFGYTAAEAIGKSISIIVPVDRSDEERRILARIRNGERLEHFETVRVSKEGKRIDVSLTVSPILNTMGQIIGVSKVARDISERINAAQALRESELRFRILANHAPVGIFQTNLSGETTFVNKAWCQLAGLDLSQAIGGGWINAVHPDDRERVLLDWQVACYAGLPSRREFRFQRPDGSVVWLQGNAEPLRDPQGNMIGYIGTVADMTARKIAEQALSDNERRLATELANMNSLYELTARLLATENLNVALNEVLLAAIDLQNADFGAVHILDDISGEFHIAAQHGFDQELLDRFANRKLDSCSASGRAFGSGTRAIIEDVEHDPDYVDFLPFARATGYRTIQSTPLISRGGKMLGLLSTHFRTSRKFDARELRMLDLYARQAADFIEQIQMINAMREADHRKDEFLAMLSHELRNPLAPIRSGLDCLATDNPQAGEVVDIMRDQVEHLVRLVDDLLDMSRIARGKIELRNEVVAAAILVDRAVDSISWAFKAKYQSLEVIVPEEEFYLKADPVRLVQVLGNLLNNASKYTPEGGHVELSVTRNGDQVAFQITDNGIGIERELLPCVFDLFTQSSRALDRSQGGMGIGLTLVRRLVELHGGSVSAESDGIGQGSRFTIKLPICEQIPTCNYKPVQTINDGRRILVVDDNYGAARLLKILLKKLGNHEVEVAYDGPSALDQLTVFAPEIVLLDIGLPGMNGYEIARKMRDIAGNELPLLVALTGYGRPEDISKSKAAGFDEHLVKPPSVEMLQAVLTHPRLVRLSTVR